MGSEQQIGLVCPNCQQIDQVQKVSAVVDTGTTASAFIVKVPGRAIRGRAIGQTRTDLSIKLAPPPEPQYTRNIRRLIASSFLITLILVIAGIIFNGGVTILSDFSGSVRFTLGISVILMSAIPFLGLIPITKSNNKYKQRAMTELDIIHRTWEESIRKWKELYYCARCDRVFLQNQQDSSPAENIMKFIGRPTA
jgi:hypothetical protein